MPKMRLSDKLREYIPEGDGYNSDYANTLYEAAELIDKLTKENNELSAAIEQARYWGDK